MAKSQSPLCEEEAAKKEDVSSFVIPLTLDWQVPQPPQDGPKTVVWEGDLPGGGQRHIIKGSNSSERYCNLNRHSSLLL